MVDAVVQPRRRVAVRQAGVAAQSEDVRDAVVLQPANQGVGAVDGAGFKQGYRGRRQARLRLSKKGVDLPQA